MSVAEFQETLTRLGLAQYHDGFMAEAFDSWQVLADITEEDLDALGVKLGHRRVLQRAIAEYQRDGVRSLAFIDSKPNANQGNGAVNGYIKTEEKANGVSVTSQTSSAPKRKYRRHPKPDENAPERPPSAYVLFSNQVREHLRDRGQELSFTEIAKAVGERWQVLPHDEKAVFESRSQAVKDRYYSQLAEYKKTKDYAEYQKYLAGFRTKHEGSEDAKRRKDEKSSSSARRESDDKEGSSPGNEASSTHSSDRHHSEIGSAIGTTRVNWPAHGQPEMTSPRTDHYSVAASGSSGHSPRQITTSGFTAIKPPHPQPHPQHQKRSPKPSISNQVGNVDGKIRYEHPMALSTSLAFGFMTPMSSGNNGRPMYFNSSSISTPLMSGGPKSDHTRLPPIRHPELLHAAHSPFGGQPPASESPSGGLSNRQLPPPIPSRLSNSSIPGGPTSPKAEHLPQHSLGIASLLRAGEHIASNESNSTPAIESPQTEDNVSSARKTELAES